MSRKRVERDYFYLKGTELLGEVIDLIRKAKGKEIVLVVPPDSPVFAHPVHIEILATEIKKSKKEVFVSTDDLRIIDLCRHYGIPLFLEEYKQPLTSEKVIQDLKPAKEKSLPRKKPLPKINFWLIKPALILFVLLLVGLIIFTTFQTKAKIKLTLAREKVVFSEVIQTDDDALRVDLAKLLLPAEVITLEVSQTVSVETTGRKTLADTRPRGFIEIENYNQVNLPLVAGTRFVYANKTYRILERVVIPARSGQEPGRAVVEVVADRNYDDIIEPGTTFLIPGLQGTLWEPLVKAVAKTQIKSSGGEVKVVNPEDITSVRLELEKVLKEELANQLALQYQNHFYAIEGGIFTLDLMSISHKVGEISDRISAAGKAKLQTVVIQKEDLLSLIKGLVLEEKEKQKVVEVKIEKLEVLDLNLEKNTSILEVKAEVVLLPLINLSEIKEKIRGQEIERIKDLFADDERIAKAQIEIFPSWRSSLPKDSNRITIVIE